MPCSECGHILFANHRQEKLLCPQCIGLNIVDRDVVEQKIERDRQLLRDENIAQLLQDYDRGHLLLYLIERLNTISHDFYNTRQLNMREFAYINYLIKLVYSTDESEFGDEYLDTDGELDDTINTLLTTRAELVRAINHVEDRFRLCLEYPTPSTDETTLFGEYDLRDTEYRYCFHRCLRSLIGGQEEDIELYDKTHEKIRNFDRPSTDEIESLEDFCDTFYEFILAMLFIASADNTVGDIYRTPLPDHVSVFDLSDLLDQIDQQFTNEEGEVLLQDSTIAWTNEDGLAQAGKDTFGDDWAEVRDYLVVGENNLDAHPFLFKVTVTQPYYQQQGRPPKTRQLSRIVYPRWYAQLLRYQIFPQLQNGDEDSGPEILNTVGTRRGEEFEKNLHDYLTTQGFECYHSAEIPGEDASEIDLLAVNDEDDELWFIECKYLMPKILMNTAEGVESLNKLFDKRIFNIQTGEDEESLSGLPYPEKVDIWLELDSGARFRANYEAGERTDHEIQSSWQGLDARMMVVSNLVPSYVEKESVEFRTDLELLELIEFEDSIYKLKY